MTEKKEKQNLRQIIQANKWESFLALFLLLVFTITGSIIHNNINNTDKGDISLAGAGGDAFNGYTAPIISLISSILIYVTFRAQNKANRKQQKAIKKQVKFNEILRSQWQYDKFLRLHTDIKYSFEKIQITFDNSSSEFTIDDSEPTVHYGKDALEKIAFKSIEKIIGKRLALQQFEHVLQELIFLVDSITKEKFYDSLLRRIITANYDANYAKLIERLTVKIMETNGYDIEYADLLAAMGSVSMYVEDYRKTILQE